MKDKMESLRMKYNGFRRGKKSALAVRDEAQVVFEEAIGRGNPEFIEEVRDMIMDLEFFIEENKCKCHRKSPVIGLFQPFGDVHALLYVGLC